jgi:hypothetical protein
MSFNVGCSLNWSTLVQAVIDGFGSSLDMICWRTAEPSDLNSATDQIHQVFLSIQNQAGQAAQCLFFFLDAIADPLPARTEA